MTLDTTSRTILRELCMNSKVEMTEIAKKAGCSRLTVAAKIKRLEKELGLRYVPEFNLQALGLEHHYIIAVKLRGVPDAERLRKLLGKTGVIQFAAICEGDFNLLIYAAARKQLDYARCEFFTRASLKDSLIEWRTSHEVFPRFGFFPLRTGTFGGLGTAPLQKKMLAALAENARVSLAALAKNLGTTKATARYTIDSLVRKGYIKRFTAVIQRPPKQYELPFFMKFKYSFGYPRQVEKARRLMASDAPGILTNTYSACIETSGHADAFLWVSDEDVGSCYAKMREMERVFGGSATIESAWIREVLLGLLPLRNVDVAAIYDRSQWLPEKEG